MTEIQGKSIRVSEGSCYRETTVYPFESWSKFYQVYTILCFCLRQNVSDSFSEFFIYIYG